MAETRDTPRIQSLKARLKADPESRVFYQLAEELRKAKQYTEAEKVLRDGLEHHSDYLSAWVSLGRVLVVQDRHAEGIAVFQKALSKDPHNVVTARLLADAHFAVGEDLEAIKRYKLVRALHPQDEEVHERIAVLEKRLGSSAHGVQAAASADALPEDEREPEAAAQSEKSAEPEDATVTMGDLYASQGHVDEAKQVYESVLSRSPEDERAGARLGELDGAGGEEASEQASSSDNADIPEEPPAGEEEDAVAGEQSSPWSKDTVPHEEQEIDPRRQRLEDWLSRLTRTG